MKHVVLIAGAALVGYVLYKKHMENSATPVYSGGIAGTSSQLSSGDPAPALPSLATPPILGEQGIMRILPVARSSPDAIMGFDPLYY